LNWGLVNTSSWLTVYPTNGTLKPGGAAAVVKISLNSTASNFLIGNYSGNIAITDQGDGTIQNRQFDLDVGNGGFESGDFTDWEFVGNTNYVFTLSADDADVAGTNALIGAADALFVHSGLYGAYLGEYPTDGTLSQTVATVPGQQYMVSFWLTSVAYQGATTPNDFTARWNDTTLYTRTNLGAFGWTNLQFVVPATAARTTLEFEFENTPAGFGLDDVRVEAAPGPVLQSVTLAGGTISLTWTSTANRSYQIQETGDLASPNWVNVGAAVAASGGTVTASEPNSAGSQQFYRIIQLAP
jgi:hypothetical protein